MYNGVSAAYKAAIKADVRTVRMTGSIAFESSGSLQITDDNILQGSLYIDSRCVSGDDLEVGALYSSELGLSIQYDGNNPYNFKQAIVSPVFGLWLEEYSEFEDVPLGHFTVSEVSRNGDYVKLICLDNMIKFDKKIPTSEFSYTEQLEKPYKFIKKIADLIIWCCEQCGVATELKSYYFNDYPNAQKTLGIDVVYDDIPTYRDILSAALQLIGSFGYIDRQGYFCVGNFQKTAADTSTPYDRFSLTYSDYEVYGVGFTHRGILSGGGYYSVNLDDNIFLNQYERNSENSSKIAEILRNIYTGNQFEDLAYIPAQIESPGDPTIELGQMIEVSAVIPSTGQYTYAEIEKMTYAEIEQLQYTDEDVSHTRFNIIVMHYNWVYRGNCTIYSYGKSDNLRRIYKK